ncbi:MAG: bifunctional demethylmenaquinone methyltransferase/2-methoxy-6-polyprenyl-1,4-benzoquinol methylase UbiE [Thermoguttaceae bacterium]|nr:bifunctional demethylmenaquinone methyltransferase/2-methoxy-6-polyprenyl-1,4-benzoquinol methylase UbiE [Thermoguttaceae bacterium]MDW8037984.1 bifunctional demethylmenaquinone methyltransferase/2-methoxy-6-polyprenyl-1,4-benzoquinol methylase UbiE [Thermoguttaceae bacterium]
MGVDKSGQRVRQMFGQIAWRYDFLNHLLSLGMDYRWRQIAVCRAPPMPGLPILDICTGTADLALAYWRASRAAAPVVGVDFCRLMLLEAWQKTKRFGAKGLRLIEADATALPFPSNLFQIVSVAFGLRNIQQPEKALREMVRVCRGGGRVVILEFSLPQPSLVRRVYAWYFRWILPRIGQALAPNQWNAYYYLPISVEEFPPEHYWTERMKAAGLAQIYVEPLTFGIATLYLGQKPF